MKKNRFVDDSLAFIKVEGEVKEVTRPSVFDEEDDDWLDALVNAFKTDLLYRVNSNIAPIYIAGWTQIMTWGKTKMGIPIQYEGPPIKQAIEWSSKHCAKLVTKMDDETKARLADVISKSIGDKKNLDELSRLIKNEFDNMSKTRADLIAKTETGKALRSSAVDRMKTMGIEGKEWILGSGGQEGNCEDCIANANVGIIPVDQEFPTPEDDIHPGCTCAVAPANLK